MTDATHVDVSYPVARGAVPYDHGYALFSAISRRIPTIHEPNSWGVLPIHGTPAEGRLEMNEKSHVTLRVPLTDIGDVIGMRGEVLDLGNGFKIPLETPKVRPLTAAHALWARMVTIKGAMEHVQMLQLLGRALERLGINPKNLNCHLPKQRTLQIKGAKIVGFQVILEGFTPSQSLLVQCRGLGGRRHMGAGTFLPFRG